MSDQSSDERARGLEGDEDHGEAVDDVDYGDPEGELYDAHYDDMLGAPGEGYEYPEAHDDGANGADEAAMWAAGGEPEHYDAGAGYGAGEDEMLDEDIGAFHDEASARPDDVGDAFDVLVSPRAQGHGARAEPELSDTMVYEREDLASAGGSLLGLVTTLSRGSARATPRGGAQHIVPGTPTGAGQPQTQRTSGDEADLGADARRVTFSERGGGGGVPARAGSASGDARAESTQPDGQLVDAIVDRDALLLTLHALTARNLSVRLLNQRAQHNIQMYYELDNVDKLNQEAAVLSGRDHEKQYQQSLALLEELRARIEADSSAFASQVVGLERALAEKAQSVAEAESVFVERKRDVCRTALHSRKGTPLPPTLVAHFEQRQAAKDKDVSQIRLRSIKLTNQRDELQARIEAMERDNSLHVIDFEQKKIENQTYNEKIEERNEELLKLRKKITTTVQILTHVKEKLEFVRRENGRLRENVLGVRDELEKERANLAGRKATRDQLRTLNVRLKEQAGLVGDYPLLRDFERRSESVENLEATLAELRERHRTLTRQTERLIARQKAYAQRLRVEMLAPASGSIARSPGATRATPSRR